MEEWEPIVEKWDFALKVNGYVEDPIPLTKDETDSTSVNSTLSIKSSSIISMEPLNRPSSPTPPDPPGLQMQLCSPSILNVNFSKQMLSTLIRTSKAWSAEMQEAEDEEKISLSSLSAHSAGLFSEDHSYYIRNLTGFDLYWAAHLDQEGEEDGAVDVRVLPDNTQQPLGKGLMRRGRRVGAADQHQSAVENWLVSLELEYFPPIIGTKSYSHIFISP
jgi:hypothetical protein